MLFVGVAGLAVVLALLLVALFPDSEPDPPPAPGGQSVVAADTTRWEAVHAALTQIRVEAPTVLPGGYELASLSQWRPRWSSTEAIWSWLLHGPAGSWIVVTADPATGGEAFDLAGFGLGGSDGDRAVLEWQDSGYTVRVVGSGVALTELQQVAAGIGSWEAPSVRSGHASVIGYLPAGFTVPAGARQHPGRGVDRPQQQV